MKLTHFYTHLPTLRHYFFETTATDGKEEYYIYYPADIRENNFIVNWSRVRVIKKKDIILDEWSDSLCL